jgi:hypothetical protein
MLRTFVSRALLGALALAGSAESATIQTSVHQVGPLWELALTVGNDGAPAEIGHFTVYFDESLFSALQLTSSPAGWDSLVIQPDLAIPAAGYLDALVTPPQAPLAAGQSQGGFKLSFAYSGIGAPGSLPFDIVSENYDVLYHGQTVAVPEPATALLGLAGGGLLLARLRRRAPAGAGHLVEQE